MTEETEQDPPPGKYEYTVGVEIEAACRTFGKYQASFHDELIGLLDRDIEDLRFREDGFAADAVHWVVKDDDSVAWQGELGEGQAETVELNSPIWKYGDGRDVRELASIFQVLTAQSDESQADRFDTDVNETCAFQVHVGGCSTDGDQGIYNATSAKNLAMIVTAAEPLINQMHAAHRNRGGPGGLYCRPPSLQWHGRSRRRLGRTLEAALAPDLDGVTNLFWQVGDSASPAYHLKNLVQSDDYRQQTVEFRQHEGTLETSVALAWIEFCVALVRTACESHLQDVFELIRKTNDETYDLDDFLETIGLSTDSRDMYVAALIAYTSEYPTIDQKEKDTYYQSVFIERIRAALGVR